ncbi:hypothetical protein HYO65_gp034 [Tenacibaculum phage PTm1]|uniref:Uncharacterized protein n=1 Tax=Tenacibaculum phage PTm1 TaxID=2547425 RepID=A0A5S9HX50_9CAUD|nr:hypothetical protein HYO65_gp034 [Tenacibaculum phage PTm1]BBI90426.1 hypothetical protein [Tenacibaculum phage PTm1]
MFTTLTILTSIGQTTIKFPPLKQITESTYEIHISDIRTANMIFLEHDAYSKELVESKKEIDLHILKFNNLVEVNKSLESEIKDLNAILLLKDDKINLDNTYYTSKLKSIKRQRNKAYIIGGVGVILGIILAVN